VPLVSKIARLFLALACALILAVITHLLAILIMPWTSQQHAANRLALATTAERAQLVAGPGIESWLPLPDPAMAVSACVYDLSEGPFRLTSRSSALMTSVAFHSRGSGIFYAVTDRAAIDGALDILVVTRAQRDLLDALENDEGRRREIRVVAPATTGFAVVRVLAPLASTTELALAQAEQARCTTQPLPGS
jgi:uncharacterized membrane protein